MPIVDGSVIIEIQNNGANKRKGFYLMKFLYFGDLHERPTSPTHRKDDFQSSINEKIAEIRSLGAKHKVKAFLQPGDFLDQPKYDPAFISKIINKWGFSDIQHDVLSLAKGDVTSQDVIEKFTNNIPMVGAIGNHELYGNALKSYPRTSLAFLEKIGFMHLPTRENPFLFTDENGLTVAISATHYDTHMDHPDHIDDYIVEKKHGDYHIHIVHGYLTNKDMGDIFPHTTVDDIAKKTKADLTITGHDHIGFKAVEVDGKHFVNPGAIARLSSDVKEVKRRPKVLLIDITKEKGITLKNVYLKSAKKGEDVLDRSHKAFQASMSSKMEEIKSLVNKSNIGSGLSVTDIIKAISKSENIDDSLKDRAIEAVTKKMDTIQKPSVNTDEYIINKITLENFQSHQNSEYELKDGLNVFIGESSSGKSAIQRALAWVYENEGVNPRRFIKSGESFAKVSLYLSSGMIITRLVEKKKNGKNGYEVFNPQDGETDYYNTRSLPLIQEYLGFTYLQIDEKKSVPLNFQKQGMSWFFIGDGFTNSDRAKIIGAVYQTHYVDSVIKDIESNAKKYASRIKLKKDDIVKIDGEIEKFDHLPSLEKSIVETEKRLEKVELLQAKLDKAQAIMLERQNIAQEVRNNELVIKSLGDVEEAGNRLDSLLNKVGEKKQIDRLNDDLLDYTSSIKKEQQTLDSLKFTSVAETKLEELQNKVDRNNLLREKWERAVQLEFEMKNTTDQIKASEKVIESNKNIPTVESKLEQVETKSTLLVAVKKLVDEIKEITRLGKSEREMINQLIKDNEVLVRQYQALLKEAGTCPMCQSEVDEMTIGQISENYLLTNKKERIKHVS